ncbi:A/G-specific DNA-adenine glycosylase [Fontimonas thermophila]|uniref:Adenine DNA glycosylase n=1 Tax=Fontimonas thermophila TaxID=1076937 RepID=A0A1I2JC41_9GAMM|nr:A/G-specific adenine glycosylase [Fontimonas thermophila]SFF51668.1 A/G-specific DNA-adenine glycosylase [Fontimonas thermophila]
MSAFAQRLLAWFDQHGRHDLPWQHPREAYRVWLAEIMLQQTQVATVIPYFTRFIARFPDIHALAAAPLDDVLALWSGLGYYARARNLHRCARQIVAQYGGTFPRTLEALMELPGIGRSTAGAILAQAFGQRTPILDGNVRRVLARYGAVPGWPGTPAVQKRLWQLAEALLPDERMADYTQAIMDLGATVCTARKPACVRCPVAPGCAALAQNAVAEYPHPRSKKKRPQRHARLLLIRNPQGQLLLERRAPLGIWGGLWCPPLLGELHLASGTWAQILLDTASRVRQLPPLRHAFTHFDLELRPLQIELDAMPELICEPGQQLWVSLSTLSHLGLPAPVRRLIEQSFSLGST